jgi:hypothetical protein
MKFLTITWRLGFIFLIFTFEGLTAKPLIYQDKNECWVISAREVISRDKDQPEIYYFKFPIYKGEGDIVEESELYKISGPNFKNESLLSFCETKGKGQKREDVFKSILNFYKKSLLVNKNILLADRLESDGTTALVTYEIKIGNADVSLKFLIPDSDLLDWNSNDIRKLKVKNTSAPIYFSFDIGFMK